jgi:hypothetical protein
VTEPPGRLRAPLMAALLLSAAVVGSGLYLERSLGPRPLLAGDVPGEISGAWFCPHGGGTRWQTWIVVANPSDEHASLRVVTYGSEEREVHTVSVGPGGQRYVEVPAAEMSSGTAVEYFGGPVAAGMVSARDRERGVAAEPCAAAAGETWFLPDGSTRRGFGQRLVVMNPFAERAVLDVVLVGEDETFRPGELTGIVLGPRRTIALDLGDFALEQRTLAAIVTARLGRVAAAGVGFSDGGLRTTIGAREPARSWVLPGAADRADTQLTVLAPGEAPVPCRVRSQHAEEQVELGGEADVRPLSADTLELDAPGQTLLVAAEGPEPFVAARRLARGDDLGSTSGVAGGAARWVSVPASPPTGATSFLVVENPGDEVAEARISLLTSAGRAEAPSIARLVLAGGRAHVIPLEELVGEEPVSVLVETDQGMVVVAQAAHTDGGFAVSAGVPIPPLG